MDNFWMDMRQDLPWWYMDAGHWTVLAAAVCGVLLSVLMMRH